MAEARANQSSYTVQSSPKMGSLAESIAAQLRMAGVVQRDFLPKSLPDSSELRWSALFVPAEWVSGDIYDVERLDETHIGFYVADVVGHGMPAALLTMFVKQALVMRETEGNSYRIFSPKECLASLNERMAEQKLSGNQFASCCYCLLDTERMQVVFARAGHPYPVLIRPGSEPRQLITSGNLLGVFGDTGCNHGAIQLMQGDKFLVYSDGVEPFIGEFTGTGEFRFGERFKRMCGLPVEEMFSELESMAVYQGPENQIQDDITAVCLEVR